MFWHVCMCTCMFVVLHVCVCMYTLAQKYRGPRMLQKQSYLAALSIQPQNEHCCYDYSCIDIAALLHFMLQI